MLIKISGFFKQWQRYKRVKLCEMNEVWPDVFSEGYKGVMQENNLGVGNGEPNGGKPS